MLTITRKDLLLTVNDNVIPAMGSSDVPVKFINDTETYVGFLIEPRVGYYVNGCPKSTVCEYDISSNTIKIPAEAFKNKGILVIAIALIDNADSNHIEVTKELALEVTPAPNGTVILPATDTWQTAVKNLVEQLYNQDYKPQFDQIEEDLSGLVEEAENQQSKAKEQQTQIDNAIDIMGDYEIVQDNPTQIRFKKGDGTYGDTVNLGDNLASKSMVNAGYDTYSGNSYSGPSSDYGIEIGKASGNYEQVTTTGKNLFDINEINTVGSSLINNGNGSLTVKAGSTSSSVSSNVLLSEACPTLEVGKTYVLQANSTGSNKFIYLSGINVSLYFGSSFTVTQSHLDSMILFYASGTDTSATISDIQIELGSVSTDYEPFTGGEPSPNPDYAQEPKFFEPKNVYSVGKNLFDFNFFKNDYVYGGTKTYTDNSITLTSTSNDCFDNTYIKDSSFFIKVKPNTKYTLLFKRNSLIGGICYVFEYNINKNMLSPYQNKADANLNVNFTFTTKPNCEFIKFRVGINTSGRTCTFSDFVILEGEWTWETVGKFIPYKGNSTTPLNITLRALPNGVKDTYEDGVITRRVGEFTFDGSADEEWRLIDTNNGYTRFAIDIKSSNFSSILCNNLKVVNGIPSTYTQQCTIEYDDYIARIITNNDNASTVEELRTYLQSNPVTMWCQVTTPTTEYYSFPIISSYYPYTNVWHDSDVEANDLTWHVLTAVNGKSSIRDGLGALLKDAPMTPNDNLLINSDYRSGIINQKGITSLNKSDGSTELGIDGWILYGINIAVGTNYVTFANRTSAIHTVQQPLDIKGLKAGDKVTFYASCFNITGNIYIYLTGLDTQKKKLTNGDNEFTFSLTSGLQRFYIELEPNAVVSFNCKKLEIGEHFTGMPAWNEASELLKCMYYFQIIYVKAQNNNLNASNRYYSCDTMFVVPMKKTPSVTMKKAYQVNGTDITSALTGTEFAVGNKNVGSIVIPSARSDTMIKFDLWLDAYDY